MTRNDFLEKYNLTEGQFSGMESIPGDLFLDYLTAIPDGFNPTVGGSLYLNRLKTIPDGFNPNVGGNLYVNGEIVKKTN